VEVAHLSRLVTPAEAKAVKAGLATGRFRVSSAPTPSPARASSSPTSADGHRRGAALRRRQKTALRTAAEGVHVLTLTATPSPRTLQAALVGLQELSVITTPPARRRPIRTFNTPFDPVAIRGALLREQRRGGQSFVVVPRIEDMEPMAARLAELAPELTVFAAHGKMPAAEVDDVMVRFAAGEGDVLLATNIIESGLDVPAPTPW
jgi:transcription-repair coupling factor (superfamily II helicase)